jgi:hypothetical protein
MSKPPLVDQPSAAPTRKWWAGLLAGVVVNMIYAVLDYTLPGHPFTEFKAEAIGWLTTGAMAGAAYMTKNRA